MRALRVASLVNSLQATPGRITCHIDMIPFHCPSKAKQRGHEGRDSDLEQLYSPPSSYNCIYQTGVANLAIQKQVWVLSGPKMTDILIKTDVQIFYR